MTREIVDIHCHILPGVDDGSQDMEETLRMLHIAEQEGITRMIVTPHYRSGRFSTPADEVHRMVDEVQEIAADEGIDIRLYPGTEIYYRSELEEYLDSGRLATMNGGRRVLVEFSPFEEFGYIRNAMDELQGMGYIPILAHVERFKCMTDKAVRVEELKGRGCEIQANAGSITGDFGFRIKRYLHGLLKNELIDYIGTDAHSASGRAPYMKKCAELLYKKYDADYADAVLFRNAEKNLLENEDF